MRAFLIALAVLCLPFDALAQQDAADAERLFALGEEAFQDGRAADATTFFEASIAAMPSAVGAWNFAVALRATGKRAEAFTMAERLLAGEFPGLDEELRVGATSLQSELRPQLSRVHVRVDSSRIATLLVDGSDARELQPDEGAALWLEAGPHSLRVRAGQVLGPAAEVVATPPEGIDLLLQMPEAPATRSRRRRNRWIVVAVSLVAVGVAVGLGLGLSREVECDADLGCLEG